MPELDFMVTADYVRAEGGVLHMIAAGFDTMWVPGVPTVRQVGVGMRIILDVAEAAEEHRIALIYQNADGQRLLEVKGTLGPAAPGDPLPPEGRPFGIPAAFNLPLPVPAYGDYSLELFIDSAPDAAKSITLSVVPLSELPGRTGHA